MTEMTQEEISLLDMLVFLAENWLILIFGPLIVGAAVYFATNQSPATYLASLEIELPSAQDRARPSLVNEVQSSREGVTASMQDDTVFISVSGATPRQAEAGAIEAYNDIAAVITSALADRLSRLEQTRALLIRPVDELSASDDPQAILATADLLVAIAPIDEEIFHIENDMRSLDSPARVSVRRTGQSPALQAIIAAMGSGLILLILLATRKAMLSATATDEGREKIQRIKRAFFIAR